MPPRSIARDGGMIRCPPIVDLSWRSDVDRLLVALEVVDAEVLVPFLISLSSDEPLQEMWWEDFQLLVDTLRFWASTESPVASSSVKGWVEGIVNTLVTQDIDPAPFLIRANLVLRHLHRRRLRRNYRVYAGVVARAQSDAVRHLIGVLRDWDNDVGRLAQEQKDRLEEIGRIRAGLGTEGEEAGMRERLVLLEQTYLRVRQESADMKSLHLLGLPPVEDAFRIF